MDTILFLFFINILALSNIKHYTVKLLCIVGPRYLFGTKQIYIYIKRVFGPYVQFCFCFFFNHFLLTAWWWDNKKFTINISGSESITNSQKAWNQYGVIKEGVVKAEAEEHAKALQDAGATAELK